MQTGNIHGITADIQSALFFTTSYPIGLNTATLNKSKLKKKRKYLKFFLPRYWEKRFEKGQKGKNGVFVSP
jgi:transposase